MIRTPAAFLTEGEVRRVHEASLEILEDVGILVRNARAREIFAKHGCKVEAGGENVRFPRAVVEQHRAGMPPKFTFRARDPQFDRTVPDDAPVVITGSSAPDMVDPATGIARRALAADIARIAWLVDQLPNYDIFSVSTLADDAPPAFFSTTRLYAALKYCRKPIRISGPPEELDSILKLAHIIAGGEAAYMARPFITHHYCPCVSPLTMDYDSTETLIYYAERGLPGHPTLVPNAGLTSPLTLAGTLVQGNAEFLAAVVLEQMVRPGKATIYSSLPTVADMRTGAYAPGAIETGMLFMGVAQMARFYGVPCGGYIGLSNAKVNDAQSGFETGMSGGGGAPVGEPPLQHGGAPRRPHVVRLREGGHRRRDRGDAPPHPARARDERGELRPRRDQGGRAGRHVRRPPPHARAHADHGASCPRSPTASRARAGSRRAASTPRGARCCGSATSSPATRRASSRPTSTRASGRSSPAWSARSSRRPRAGRAPPTRRCPTGRSGGAAGSPQQA